MALVYRRIKQELLHLKAGLCVCHSRCVFEGKFIHADKTIDLQYNQFADKLFFVTRMQSFQGHLFHKWHIYSYSQSTRIRMSVEYLIVSFHVQDMPASVSIMDVIADVLTC